MIKKERFEFTRATRKGFTLIEILIVVAIIAILASVVLVGLGPTQQAGRDSRRISDLSEAQNGLELYYNKCGIYPGDSACGTGAPAGGWSDMSTGLSAAVVHASVGITAAFPNDPSSGKTYQYWVAPDNSSYVIGAHLENTNNSVFTNYAAPVTDGFTPLGASNGTPPTDCAGASDGNYCKTL
jgi:prepilin-type N-terminal cleavage/methylation domain-containing protein